MTAGVDLNDLATFVRVADTGSFSRVARDLAVPTSTVSRAIARLEERLGVLLLQRTTRKVTLTREGTFLREQSASALHSLAGAAQAVVDLQNQPQGVLRITAPQDLGHRFLGEVVAGFVDRHPGIRVDLQLTGRLVDLVGEGFDLALRAGRLKDSSMVARKLCDLQAYLIASPAYAQRHGLPATVAELEGHAHILFRAADGETTWRLHHRRGATTITARGRISADDFGLCHAAALAGAGIALCPRLLCADDLRAGRLVRVLPEHELRGSSLYLVYPSSRHLPIKVRAFRDFIAAAIADRCEGEVTGL